MSHVNIHAAREQVLGLGVAPYEIDKLPRLVRWCNCTDPWGNHLGFYQDLSRWPEERRQPGALASQAGKNDHQSAGAGVTSPVNFEEPPKAMKNTPDLPREPTISANSVGLREVNRGTYLKG